MPKGSEQSTRLIQGHRPVMLESKTSNFWTQSMGACECLIVSNGTQMMGQHCSGGVGSADFKTLFGYAQQQKKSRNLNIVMVGGNVIGWGSLTTLLDKLAEYRLTSNVTVSIHDEASSSYIFPNGFVYDSAAFQRIPMSLTDAAIKIGQEDVYSISDWPKSSDVSLTHPDKCLDLQKRREWVADSSRNDCPVCFKQFSFSRRRHHCRRCGCLVCGDCSEKVVMRNALRRPGRATLSHTYSDKTKRACSPCAQIISKIDPHQKEIMGRL